MSQKNTLCGGNHCGKCCGGSCNGCGSLELTQAEATFLLTFSVLPFQAVVGKDISDFPVYAYPVCALEENPGPDVRPELISVLAGKGLIEVDYDIPLSNYDYRELLHLRQRRGRLQTSGDQNAAKAAQAG